MILPHQDTFAGILIQQSQAALKQAREALGGPALTVLDIGAHYGCFTMAALEAGATRVCAVEASATNYAGLIQNLRANKVFPWPAAPIHAAAWEGPEGTLMNLRRAGGGNSGQYSLYYDIRSPIVEAVPSISFSALFAAGPWDYVKMDIEGGEWSWLTGPEVLRGALSHTRCLDLEIHPLDNADYFTLPQATVLAAENGGARHPEDIAKWAESIGARVLTAENESMPTRLLILAP